MVLPHFAHQAQAALETARKAESLGIDGVFCYEHLWPMGAPQRPALSPFPLLGAVAAGSRGIHLGTLVARVGLVPDEVLVAEFESLEHLAPKRVIAGLGIGDSKSAEENRAYGLADSPPGQRRGSLDRCATELQRRGIPVWIGSLAPPTQAVARKVGACVNLWGAELEAVAAQAQKGQVSWAGAPPPGSTGPAQRQSDALADWLRSLRRAGATWAVFGPPPTLEDLAEARQVAGS